MLKQRTLRQPATFSGTGLHGGHRVNLSFLPAPVDSGIRFRRMDLDGKPEIEARIENVSETNRSTTLSKGNIKIHTVEHVLATFAGFGIDNAIIELDANEPPIGDGSARAYCRMIENAGIEEQSAPRLVFSPAKPLEFQAGEANMSVFPSDRLKISCTSADRHGRFTQFYSLEISPESWEQELAPARTFCFFEEIEFLIKSGLIKGGSLENAVVIRDDAVLTTEPLRFPDEFVRHKILDILGDLALVGRPVQAHIVAIKPSHTANCELARRLRAQMEERPMIPPADLSVANTQESSTVVPERSEVESPPVLLDINGILKYLPHRPPFLMVDAVLRIEENRIVGVKNVSMNEPYFQGHFPNHPIMPGVLQLEAIAQVAGILLLRMTENCGKIAYFLSAEKVKWRKPVRPGDQLTIDVEIVKFRGKIAKARGVCLVHNEVVSEGEVAVMLMES